MYNYTYFFRLDPSQSLTNPYTHSHFDIQNENYFHGKIYPLACIFTYIYRKVCMYAYTYIYIYLSIYTHTYLPSHSATPLSLSEVGHGGSLGITKSKPHTYKTSPTSKQPLNSIWFLHFIFIDSFEDPLISVVHFSTCISSLFPPIIASKFLPSPPYCSKAYKIFINFLDHLKLFLRPGYNLHSYYSLHLYEYTFFCCQVSF